MVHATSRRYDNSMNPSWLTWAVLSAFFAALTTLFAKIGLRDVNADLATWIRTVVILVTLGVFVAATGKWSNPLALSARTMFFLVISALATGASWVCYFRALQMGEAAKVAAIDKLSLIIVAALGFAFLQDRPSAREWLGILLIGAGTVILALRR